MITRRKLIAAAAGASGLALAARLASRYGLVPPDYLSPYGPGNTLTYAAQRLLAHDALAREFPRSAISKDPFAKQRPFQSEPFERLRANNFLDWRLQIEGMVTRPISFSLPDLRSFPASTQITQLTCEEGWSFIAEWSGVKLARVLEAAQPLPQARYLIYDSMQPRWTQSIDMTDALHPQTLLVYGMNGGDLPYGHGGPLRLRVPRQLGYKSVKFVHRIVVTDTLNLSPRHRDYAWYAGI